MLSACMEALELVWEFPERSTSRHLNMLVCIFDVWLNANMCIPVLYGE